MTAPLRTQDTIAAVATPAGNGGIAVIRISGPDAVGVADRVFRGRIPLSSAASHTVHYGSVVGEDGRPADAILATVFRAPHSYTGEEVVELGTHGGHFVSRAVLRLVIAAGARPADPGEFTLRAFLNDRLDLAQAEAVADLIHARSERAHRVSMEQLTGKLSGHIRELRSTLTDLCSLLELELDFSEEGIELARRDELLSKLSGVRERIQTILSRYSTGKMAREGVRVALAGKPNVGKSSLLNILLEEERAIVSEIPGTTRDVIEESITLHGMEFVFTDTAGIRESVDLIEKEGIRRTMQHIRKADIVLFMVDASEEIGKGEADMLEEAMNSLPKHGKSILVVNKADRKASGFSLPVIPDRPSVEISCKTHTGIDMLKSMLFETAIPDHADESDAPLITNERHKDALVHALESLDSAERSIQQNMSGEFVAVDLREALNHLGDIIGLTTPEDILNNIFARFCIGK
ncbi:MAG: tRNA uridine-5-carboxymethylaminomethyl(34) synthesis GTPase MnmE [Bacteroidetes bacterium]|nr:MAG: tRNA uridine-5-carboxymethylaminomethyl(34) synthesis GTPase MnmE [Bacteroidota bacterium]